MKRITVALVTGLCLSEAAFAHGLASEDAVAPKPAVSQGVETAWLPWWVLNGPRCMVSPGPLCVRK